MSHIYKDESMADELEFLSGSAASVIYLLNESPEEDRRQAYDRVIDKVIEELEKNRPSTPSLS